MLDSWKRSRKTATSSCNRMGAGSFSLLTGLSWAAGGIPCANRQVCQCKTARSVIAPDCHLSGPKATLTPRPITPTRLAVSRSYERIVSGGVRLAGCHALDVYCKLAMTLLGFRSHFWMGPKTSHFIEGSMFVGKRKFYSGIIFQPCGKVHNNGTSPPGDRQSSLH